MRRLIAVLAAWALACAPVAASAQGLLLLGVGNFKASGGGAYSGPLDVATTNPNAFYSLRAGSAAIAAAGTQKLVKIENLTTTETCDVKVATSGGMGNTTGCSGATGSVAPATFCSGATCAVLTWYDQTANHYDAVNFDTSITLTFNCIGTLPCVSFSGSQGLHATSAPGGGTAQPFSFSTVAKRTGNTTSESAIIATNGATFFFSSTAGNVGSYFGATVNAAAADNAWHEVQWAVNGGGAGSAYKVDAGSSTSMSPGSGSIGSWYLGAADIGNNVLVGKIAEVGMWTTTHTGTVQGNLCHNQDAYYSLASGC